MPYFKVAEGKLEEFKGLCEQFMEITKENEPDCLYYGFSIKDESYIAEKGMSMQKLC